MADELRDAGTNSASRKIGADETLLRAVFGALPVGIGVINPEGSLILSNPEMHRYLPTDRMPSMDNERYGSWRAYHPEGRRLERSEYPGARALRGERVVPGIDMLYTKDDGTEVWVRVAASPITDETGDVLGVLSVAQDIDEVKRTAEALHASEAKYRSLIEAMNEGLALCEMVRDADGTPVDYRILEINQAYSAITGLAPADIVGRLRSEMWPGTSFDEWLTFYSRVVDTGEPGVQEKFSQGLDRYYIVWAYSVGADRFVALFDDVTERKEAERKLEDLIRFLEHRVEERTNDLAEALRIADRLPKDDPDVAR